MSETMSAKDLSAKITKEYMNEAFHAHELGKIVGYTTAISPVELFVAHDVVPIYPENHAVACLTARMGTELSVATESLGYTSHLCAYSILGVVERRGEPVVLEQVLKCLGVDE